MCDYLQSRIVAGAILLSILLVTGCNRDSQQAAPALEREEVAAALAAIEGATIFVAVDSFGWFGEQNFAGWQVPVDESSARQAGVDAAYWRRLDRELRFDAVAFFGTTAESLTLFAHLLNSDDWNPVWVGNSGCVFQRWQSVDSLQQSNYPAVAARVRWLLDLKRIEAAAQLLQQLSESLRERQLVALRARIAAEQGEWGQVIQYTQQIGAEDSETARIRARALIELGRGREAWHLTRELVRGRAVDGPLLFLHARAARSAKAWNAEIEALEQLIALVESKQAPTGGYKVYLAQAYASAGQAEQALELFRQLADNETLPAAQKEFVAAALAKLEKQLEPAASSDENL